MTHGYEFFEFDYVDIDDYFGEYDYYIDEFISESWSEIEQIYMEMEGQTEDYDIYEQEEETW